jgi:hypothetical protein
MRSISYTFTDKDIVEQTPEYSMYVAPYSHDTDWKEYHYVYYDSADNKLPIFIEVYRKIEDRTILYDRVIPYRDYELTFYEPIPSVPNQLYFKVYIKPCERIMFRLYLDGVLSLL